jgi:hypothetical protein
MKVWELIQALSDSNPDANVKVEIPTELDIPETLDATRVDTNQVMNEATIICTEW